jgi:effector-binding domain-containing protein
MRFAPLIPAAVAAVFVFHAGSSLACCGTCEGDSHSHDTPKAAAPAAAPEAALSTEQTKLEVSFDGSTAPDAVTLEAERFVVLKGTLSNPVAAWQTLPGLAGAQGLLNQNTHAWSIVPTMPNMENMDPNTPYWAAFTIGPDAQPTGELEVYTSPGGKYVRAVHRGPYEDLGATWEKFARYVLAQGSYDASRPMLENYISDPGTTPAEDLITHLFIPVQ